MTNNQKLLPALYTLDVSLISADGKHNSHILSNCKSECYSCQTCQCQGGKCGIMLLGPIGKVEVEELFIKSLGQ